MATKNKPDSCREGVDNIVYRVDGHWFSRHHAKFLHVDDVGEVHNRKSIGHDIDGTHPQV